MDLSDLFNKVLFKNDHHVLYSNDSETVIYQEYFQNRSLNEKQVRQIHDLLSNKRYAAFILKVNGGGLIPNEDETWVEKLDLSVILDTGILLMAYISPNNIFSNLEIEKEIFPNSGRKIRIRMFKNPGEAIGWLKTFQIL